MDWKIVDCVIRNKLFEISKELYLKCHLEQRNKGKEENPVTKKTN